jgi:NAD-dependent dihydropyrimidine dehydrogenase PreA subunit
MQIDFNEIKSVFNEDWDVGYISAEDLLRCCLLPIKAKFQTSHTCDLTNSIGFRGINNAIVLVKQSDKWDYELVTEAYNILIENGFRNILNIYTNFKEVAISAGLGVRAKNSLIYTHKFGFDCHICSIMFFDEIINYPKLENINYGIWDKCYGCIDCYKACPVNAIRNQKEPYWLNSELCDSFIAYNNHDKIPSIKEFWHKNVHPEYNKEIIDSINSYESMMLLLNREMLYDNNGYTCDGLSVKKDGKTIFIPICRECTSQKRCSKWNGSYPYTDKESV